MKRYLLTSTKFTGTAELLYNQIGLLAQIDLTNTNMGADIIMAFKKSVPAQEANITTAFSESVNIIAADVEITFKMFWDKYGKKINRLRSEALWNKMSLTERIEAYCGIADYDKYLKKEQWRPKADPDTYLRNKYYQNEYK
jgi:hypothetical protein